MEKTSSGEKRVAGALALAVGVVSLFAALGGVGMAESATSAAQGQYGKKTTVCHKGKKTISIGNAAVPAHLRHGDTVGTCAAARAKAAKAKKAKAAKVKAAKAKSQKAKAPTPKAEKGKGQGQAEETKPGDHGNGKGNPGRGKGK